MNKAEAVDLLSNLIGMVEDSQGNDYDRALKMGIKALEKQKPIWTLCSDRLPDIDSNYLVVINSSIMPGIVEIMSYGHPLMPNIKIKKKQKCWYSYDKDCGDIVRSDVVAWAQLPIFEMEDEE